jgi:two-component system NarL family sensor kinase
MLNEIIRHDRADTFRVKALIEKGNALSHMHKYPEALEAFISARRECRIFDNKQLLSRANWGVGIGYYYMQQYDSSIQYLEKALVYYKRIDDVDTQISLLNNIAIFHAKLGRKKEVEATYELLFALAERSENKDFLFQIVLNRMTDLYDSSNYQQAKIYADEFISMLDDSGNFDLKKPYRYIARTHYQLGQHETASNYFYKYDSLASNLLDEDYNDKILELETQFKTAEIEKENALKQLQIEEQQQAQLIMGGVIVLLFLAGIGVYIYYDQKRKNLVALAAKDKQLYDRQIEELLNEEEIKTTYALLDGQDKERKRIAQELHDNISSTMATLNMFLSTFKPDKLSTKEKELLDRINLVAFQTAEDTRNLSHSLDSGSLSHFGLTVAIQDLMEAVGRSGLEVNQTIDLERPLPGDLSLNIYRITQELVNNTLKHAKAQRISLELSEVSGEYVSMIYSDDGIGFDETTHKEGIGLKNMQSRIDALEGQLTIDSQPGKYTSYIIEIPLT